MTNVKRGGGKRVGTDGFERLCVCVCERDNVMREECERTNVCMHVEREGGEVHTLFYRNSTSLFSHYTRAPCEL